MRVILRWYFIKNLLWKSIILFSQFILMAAKSISIIFWPIISSIRPELSILSLRYCCFLIQNWPYLNYICASGPSCKTKLSLLLLNHYPINFSSWFKVVSELLNLFCKNGWFCSSILRQILANDFFFLLSHKKWRPLLFRYLIAVRWSLYGGNEKEKHITLLACRRQIILFNFHSSILL